MTASTAGLLAGAALLILEGLSWVLAGLSARFLATPIPSRAAFLKEQSTKLERLARNESIRARIHPVLGWEYGTGAVSATEHLNAQGLRATREYEPAPPARVKRIAVFGDSYVYCNEVADAESWPGQIEAGWNVEVLNYGVGGYGADQAFLRFREEGARLHPEVVVIGFTSMMATRVVSRYRRFQDPGDGPWFKPRFMLEGDALRLLPAPVASRADAERVLADPAGVAQFGRDDFWYNPPVLEHQLYPWSATYRLLTGLWGGIWRRYFHADRIHRGRTLNPQSESFKIIVRILRDFATAVRAMGAQPVALMLPARGDVRLYNRFGFTSYETLRPVMAGLNLLTIDPLQALTSSATPMAELFARGGHYSAKGNAVVATTVADALHLPSRFPNTMADASRRDR